MKIGDVKKVLSIGAGTMGHQIGFLCAVHGYEVVIYDVAKDSLEFAKKRVDRLADKFISRGHIKAEDKPLVLGRISFTDDAEAAAKDVDIVTESVPESVALKGQIFEKFNALCPERTIFTTNTSTLLPSMFAAETGRPEKFLAFHFHDILHTDVVDIMPHPGTAPETVALVKDFSDSLGQTTIMLDKENIGYVFNQMLSDWFKSALSLASNGVATPEDVDRAWMGVMQAPIGPFGVIDSVGLDTVWKISDYWARAAKIEQLAKNAAFLKPYVEAGKLGLKTGEGFYTYPNPKYFNPDFLKPKKD